MRLCRPATGAALAHMAGGIFLAGLQLAAPVMAAALAVEMTVRMVSRLAPMLPAQVVGVPLKTLASLRGADRAAWRCGRGGLSGTSRRCWTGGKLLVAA